MKRSIEWRCLLRCCTGNVIGKCFVSSSGDVFCIIVPEMLSASVLSIRVAMPFASLYQKCDWEVFCQFEWRCLLHRCTENQNTINTPTNINSPNKNKMSVKGRISLAFNPVILSNGNAQKG